MMTVLRFHQLMVNTAEPSQFSMRFPRTVTPMQSPGECVLLRIDDANHPAGSMSQFHDRPTVGRLLVVRVVTEQPATPITGRAVARDTDLRVADQPFHRREVGDGRDRLRRRVRRGG